MTRRIVLDLADDSCSIYCGSCPSLVPAYEGWSARCHAFHDRVKGDSFAKLPRGLAAEAPRRLAACIEAEAKAARFVEIDPEDAARVQVRSPKRQAFTSIEAYLESVMAKCNVTKALRAHGSKR